ncbi:hypothetical protein GIB67_038230 [Kingdonia uniflora]|uniref:Aminotransferase-like plant mobile domain-containing protein n=1 Tax=Kingdonia uniflora TaxID=39325 RepID=A0A7J7NHE2_9MAGN|nr:hypothetical protein GIB67_038230 [Kingdonia uniflora]
MSGSQNLGFPIRYTMNEKVSLTASNRRKRELAREGDLVTYKRKRKRKTIDLSTVVPPNTVDSANKGVSEGVNISTKSAEGVNIPQGSEFETESAQAGLGAQPPLQKFCPDFDKNIPIFGGYSESEGATSNDDLHFVDIITIIVHEKLLIRVHHHQSTWDLRKEPQVVQDFVKLKGLDMIEAISYNYYNSALIYASVGRWQPKTNTFHFKWDEMTPTLDDVEQLVGLPAAGDATLIGAGGAGNSLSLKKLKFHYAYKLEKVLNDGTATAAKKKNGLTTRSVARAYMLYVLGSFLFPTKNGTDVSARYLIMFATDKVAKKWSWGSAVLAHMYYNLGATSRDDARQFACCTTLLESWIFAHFPKLGGIPKIYPITVDLSADDSGIHRRKSASVNKHGDTPVHQSEDIVEQYDASLQKLKEDKKKESEANINLREALKEKTSECDLLKETIEQMKVEIELKSVVDEQCVLEFADLPRQLDAKILECKNLEEKNTSLEAELRSKSGLEDYNQSLSVELNKKLVPDTTLAKKYEDVLAAHEDIKKKLIAKEDFLQKLVNAEERMKFLEANNSEWEVWRQALKKALASEGMGDMGDPTFEELFKQNERFFTITQQGPKRYYQEDLVSTAVTLENMEQIIVNMEHIIEKSREGAVYA